MTDEHKKGKKGWTRRDFFKISGAAAAVTGLAGTGLWRSVGTATAAEIPKQWDEAWDVVIIGSGFAGLAAALEAHGAGASVAVIEKMPVPGGNSTINGGDFAAAGTKMQAAEGIEDSPERMLQDMLRAGQHLNHVDKARQVAQQSNSALEWCMDYLGAKFSGVGFHGGHSVKRAHHTANGSGSEVVGKMLAKARGVGVNLQTRTKLLRLVKNGEGRVRGHRVHRQRPHCRQESGGGNPMELMGGAT